MQISSSNSEHNSEQYSESEYFEKGSDDDFEKALHFAFKEEINIGKNLCQLKEKIYKEDLKKQNNEEKQKDINEEIKDNFFIEISENEEVQIKTHKETKKEKEVAIKKEIFDIKKIEFHIAFIPGKNMEYYKKYKNNLIFNTWKDETQRKEAPDEIRKKIKSRFFKSLKMMINQEFIEKKINKKMEYLPQNFISNITKGENKLMLDKTLKEIIIYSIADISDTDKKKEKYEKNIDLLKYLDEEKAKNNKNINKIYNIFQTKIKDLFNEYLKSEEFEQSIIQLKKEGNYFEYIKAYINVADNFINFFSN